MSEEIQVITANRLLDGTVVYLTAADDWSERLTDGAVWRGKEEAEAALQASEAHVARRYVVAPYLIEVAETPDGIAALSAKERIRAAHKPTFEPEIGSWTGRISA